MTTHIVSNPDTCQRVAQRSSASRLPLETSRTHRIKLRENDHGRCTKVLGDSAIFMRRVVPDSRTCAERAAAGSPELRRAAMCDALGAECIRRKTRRLPHSRLLNLRWPSALARSPVAMRHASNRRTTFTSSGVIDASVKSRGPAFVSRQCDVTAIKQVLGRLGRQQHDADGATGRSSLPRAPL